VPYDNPKQAVAAFLNIRKRQGQRAASTFAKKHGRDMEAGAKAAHAEKAYKSRKARSK
jgi:hypothetical protein